MKKSQIILDSGIKIKKMGKVYWYRGINNTRVIGLQMFLLRKSNLEKWNFSSTMWK